MDPRLALLWVNTEYGRINPQNTVFHGTYSHVLLMFAPYSSTLSENNHLLLKRIHLVSMFLLFSNGKLLMDGGGSEEKAGLNLNLVEM